MKFPFLACLFICFSLQMSWAQAPSPIKELTTQVEKAFVQKEFKKASQLQLQAVKLAQKTFGDTSQQHIQMLEQLSNLYLTQEKTDEAEPVILQIVTLNKKKWGADHEKYAFALLSLANLYQSYGNRYEEAEQVLLEAKSITKEKLGEDALGYGGVLNSLAILYRITERYEDAEPLYIKALAIAKKEVGQDHPIYASALGNVANFYSSKGDLQKAKNYLLQASQLKLQVHGNASIEYIRSLQTLAMVYLQLKDYSKAEDHLIKALKLADKYLPKVYQVFYNKDLSRVYNLAQQPYKALQCLREALDINYEDSINLDNTQQFYQQVTQLTPQSLPAAINTLDMLCYVTDSIQPNDNAHRQVVFCDAAIELLKRLRDTKLNTQQDKMWMLRENNSWTVYALDFMNPEKDLEKIYQYSENNKSMLLLDALNAENAYRVGGLPDTLIMKEKALKKQINDLNGKLAARRDRETQDSLQKILNKYTLKSNELKKKIEKEFPRYASIKYQTPDINTDEVLQMLDDQSALIEYLISKNKVYIFCFVAHNQNKQLIVQEIELKELKDRIQKYHLLLSDYQSITKDSNHFTQLTTASYWFYQQLIAPVAKYLKDVSKLMIITDGELGHLPFESFISKKITPDQSNFKNLPYLLRDFSISYNYSAYLLKGNKTMIKQPNNGQLFAIAANYNLKDPNINHRLPGYLRQRKGLSPLPNARKEVERLADQYNGYFAFDQEASEQNFKIKAKDYSIIHLAMHGLLDEQRPILSSLAFTEDGDSMENNFLQAYEISKMELNADLVVLSACETGYGRFERGNGIASLARSFMYAGVPSLVVSLWQVNDQSTSLIMQNFYANLAEGMDKARALQQAKLTYIEQVENPIAAHPAFWSPFILIGDESPIELQHKSSAIPWWGWALAGGLLILVAGGIWSWRARRALS